jgi:hypothetical protein
MGLITILSGAFNRLRRRKRKKSCDEPPGKSERQSQPELHLADQQEQNAQTVAEQLLGRMQSLWLKRQGLDMEVRFQMGRMLFERLYPSGQDRLPYGVQVMNTVSQRLGICRPDLHRMVKLVRVYNDLATFQAQHPDVTTWDGTKQVLAARKPAQAGSSKRKPADPSKAIWKQIDKTLAALQTHLGSMPQGTKKEDAEKRQPEFQAVGEKFNTLLSNGTSVTSDSRGTVTSRKRGDK